MSTQINWDELPGLGEQASSTQEINWENLPGLPQKEGIGKAAFRTAAQLPIGAADVTRPGIAMNLWDLLGTGEALAELQEWEEGREEELREKFPTAPWPKEKVFDREKYLGALEEARKGIPTPSNIASFIEKHTGAPLEAHTKLQKLLRVAGAAGKMQPGGVLPKAQAAVIAPVAKVGLQELGVPEPLAELGGYGIAATVPKVEKITPVTKPSGLPARQFEKTTKPKTVTEAQYGKITSRVEGDIRKVTENLMKRESEFAKDIATHPNLRSDIYKGLEKVERIADQLPGKMSTDTVKQKLLEKIEAKVKKGVTQSDREKAYTKSLKEIYNELESGADHGYGDWVKQYRKTNESYGEIYKPGESKAVNRGRTDALLEYNRTIAGTFRENLPESEFVNLFDYTNKKFSQMKSFDQTNEFLNDIFKDKKINFKKASQLLEKSGAKEAFEKTLGKEGFKEAEGIFRDLLDTERSLSLLKTTKDFGFGELAKLGSKWLFSPLWGKAAAAKEGYQYLRNSLLANKQFRVTWGNAFDALKNKKWPEAEKEFKSLNDIEQRTYDATKKYYEDLNKANPSKGNKKILEEILEVNPEFVEVKLLKEPTQYFRKEDVLSSTPKNMILAKKEWDKYLNPDLFEKYYKAYKTKQTYLGKIGDIIKDPKIKKALDDVRDIPVYINPKFKRKYYGRAYSRTTKTETSPGSETVPIKIEITSNLSPHKIQSTLSHEGTHSLQAIRKDPSGMSKLAKRELKSYKMHPTPEDYLKNLNEVYARKFQRWVDQPVNKYRSELEKTKVARKYLQEQKAAQTAQTE